MRAVIVGCVLLLVGSVGAQAQPYFGDDGRGPPTYDDGYGRRPSPPRHDEDGYGRRPSPDRYDGRYDGRFEGRYDGRFDGRFGEPHYRQHRCRLVYGYDGPIRVCRPEF